MRLTSSLFFIMQFVILHAQGISGRITGPDNVPMPFVNVALLDETDSAFIAGTVSAEDGTFAISTDRESGLLRISYTGYQTLHILVKRGGVGNIQLKSNNIELKEVTVTGSNVTQKRDREIVWITPDMRRGKHNTGEMLGGVPGIHYDRMTKGLSYYSDGNIILLVDSIEKDMSYIKRLHHIRFDHMDIIPNPKGKYEGYAALINLHTRPNYEGIECSAELESDFFPSNRKIKGKVLDSVSEKAAVTYTRNKLNFFLNYGGEYDRTVKEELSETEYPMNQYKEKVIANPDHRKNKKEEERDHTLTGGMDYQFDKRTSLSIAYRLALENHNYLNRQNIVTTRGQRTDTILSNRNRDDDEHAHTLAAYYRGGFGAWNYNADVNFVRINHDTRNLLQKSSGYVNRDDRNNLMTHTLVRAELNRSFLDNKIYASVGYNNFWKKYEETRLMTSALLTDYILRQNKIWFYGSFGISNNTGISIGSSLILNNTRSMGEKDDYFSYDANCGLFQKIDDNRWLRFNYQCAVSNPNISQVTAYGQFEDSLQWAGGNPMLRSSLTHDLNLHFKFCKWISFITKYKYQPRSFSPITELRRGRLENGENSYYAATTTQNARYQNLWMGLYYWQQFGNLTLSSDWYYRYARGKYENYRKSVNYFHGNASADYFYEPFNLNISAAYNLSIDYDAWAQGTMKNQVDMFWIYLSKSFLNDRLELSCSYVLPVHLTSGDNYRRIDTPAMKALHSGYSLNRLSNNNFEIGIVYRFTGGKSVREFKREMSNEK